tara:strand:+ start:440 stop:838 length:399 start_codon:yes stop_codon:yes gene_type:complete
MEVEQHPNSVVIETRVDIRELASIHKYFTNRGLVITSRSDLLRTIVNVYNGTVCNDNPELNFETVHNAYTYLMSHGLPFGQRGTKGRAKVIRALQAESIQEQAVDEQMSNVDKDKFDEAVKMIQNLDAMSDE